MKICKKKHAPIVFLGDCSLCFALDTIKELEDALQIAEDERDSYALQISMMEKENEQR